jgi:hypothetical protein
MRVNVIAGMAGTSPAMTIRGHGPARQASLGSAM